MLTADKMKIYFPVVTTAHWGEILHRGPSQQKCFFEFIDFNIPKLTGKYRYGGYIMKSCSQPQKY